MVVLIVGSMVLYACWVQRSSVDTNRDRRADYFHLIKAISALKAAFLHGTNLNLLHRSLACLLQKKRKVQVVSFMEHLIFCLIFDSMWNRSKGPWGSQQACFSLSNMQLFNFPQAEFSIKNSPCFPARKHLMKSRRWLNRAGPEKQDRATLNTNRCGASFLWRLQVSLWITWFFVAALEWFGEFHHHAQSRDQACLALLFRWDQR